MSPMSQEPPSSRRMHDRQDLRSCHSSVLKCVMCLEQSPNAGSPHMVAENSKGPQKATLLGVMVKSTCFPTRTCWRLGAGVPGFGRNCEAPPIILSVTHWDSLGLVGFRAFSDSRNPHTFGKPP